MIVMPIVIGEFGTVKKDYYRALEDLEIRGCAETIQLQNRWDQPQY